MATTPKWPCWNGYNSCEVSSIVGHSALTKNYRATVAYDGTAYSGFQIQKRHPTIQGELESVLARLTGQPVRVNGAGRTDAGVHAHGQVINFWAAWRHSVEDLERGMNALLPSDIAVRGLAIAPSDFHARFSASRREYLYRIYIAPTREPILDRYAHRVALPLDWDAMAKAARCLVGEHDFAALGQSPTGGNTIRHVYQVCWSHQVMEWAPDRRIEVGEFRITANGFLRGMVRRAVALLLAVGEAKMSLETFQEIIASKDIRRATPPAPPCGLSLWCVYY
jgi:tRNA pseudouridine38-40 synthase